MDAAEFECGRQLEHQPNHIQPIAPDLRSQFWRADQFTGEISRGLWVEISGPGRTCSSADPGYGLLHSRSGDRRTRRWQQLLWSSRTFQLEQRPPRVEG